MLPSWQYLTEHKSELVSVTYVRSDCRLTVIGAGFKPTESNLLGQFDISSKPYEPSRCFTIYYCNFSSNFPHQKIRFKTRPWYWSKRKCSLILTRLKNAYQRSEHLKFCIEFAVIRSHCLPAPPCLVFFSCCFSCLFTFWSVHSIVYICLCMCCLLVVSCGAFCVCATLLTSLVAKSVVTWRTWQGCPALYLPLCLLLCCCCMAWLAFAPHIPPQTLQFWAVNSQQVATSYGRLLFANLNWFLFCDKRIYLVG